MKLQTRIKVFSKMSDYSNCKMYIILDDNWDCYIGHTTISLEKRMNYHKHKSNKGVTKQMMDKNPIIELLEDYPCKDKREAEHREQYWMDQFPNRLNGQNAIEDKPKRDKAYQLANSEKIKANKEKYYENNKEKWVRTNVDLQDIYGKRRDIIKEKGAYTCECGTVITYNMPDKIRRHKKSKKHLNYNLTQLHNNDSPNV